MDFDEKIRKINLKREAKMRAMLGIEDGEYVEFYHSCGFEPDSHGRDLADYQLLPIGPDAIKRFISPWAAKNMFHFGEKNDRTNIILWANR